MSVETKIKDIIAEQLGINEDDIAPESSLSVDLGADSLDIIELVMALEEEFEMEIADEEAEQLDTVNDFIEFVSRRSC
ncbi:MAG: acyl carrier protein [Deltaproteobacteria bacterium CG11_big_fil_rev_8_21_14_0_20_49_13]|nr:MAG: acyl carrier protein [Deltaproteobacteria bacterium CG11_big_fil_rev_8_21_14_0_20_49_13]